MSEAKSNYNFLNKYTIAIAIIIIFAVISINFSKTPSAEPEVQTIRPVRTVVIAHKTVERSSSLTGEILAQNEIDLSFQINGKLTERLVSVGDQIKIGQVVAYLDPQDAKNNFIAAKSTLTEAQSLLTQAIKNEERQKTLLSKGVITNAKYEDAIMRLQSAQAKVQGATATSNQAQIRLNYTTLKSDVSGIVIATNVEPGEVLMTGQSIIHVATDEGKDAVFRIPEQILQNQSNKELSIEIALAHDSRIKTIGRVREISPQADPLTRTFTVKVGLTNPPKELKLGSTVTGSIIMNKKSIIEIPVMSLNRSNTGPAVWVVNPENNIVNMRDIKIASYTENSIIVEDGLKEGDIVVTAGVHLLYPGQQVKLMKD